MKNIFLLTFACIISVLFVAHSNAEEFDDQKLKTLFYSDFLEANDNDLLDLAVCSVISSSERELAPSQLKEQFKSLVVTPELEKRFLAIYATELNAEEIEEALALFEDTRYLKLRKKIAIANFKCFKETEQVLETLAVNLPGGQAEIPAYPIINVNKKTFEELKDSSRPLILDVYTDWCGPCKSLAPVIKELNQEYGNLYQFAKLNADREKVLAKSLKVSGVPTVIFFKNGKEVGRQRGFVKKEKFLDKIKELFPGDAFANENSHKEFSENNETEDDFFKKEWLSDYLKN